MAIQACPTARIQAPAERIRRFLAIQGELQRWSGVKIMKSPERLWAAGDQVVFRTGLVLVIDNPGAWLRTRYSEKAPQYVSRRLTLETPRTASNLTVCRRSIEVT